MMYEDSKVFSGYKFVTIRNRPLFVLLLCDTGASYVAGFQLHISATGQEGVLTNFKLGLRFKGIIYSVL